MKNSSAVMCTHHSAVQLTSKPTNPRTLPSTAYIIFRSTAMCTFPTIVLCHFASTPSSPCTRQPSHPPKHSLQALIHNLVLMQHAHLVRYITCVLERPHHMPHSHRVCYLTRVFKRPYHAACAPSALSYPCVRTATPYAALPPCMF